MDVTTHTHLTVPGGEDGSEDLSVLPHLLKLLLQGTLHVGVGQHVFYHVFLQRSPQRSLIGAVELKPEQVSREDEMTFKSLILVN